MDRRSEHRTARGALQPAASPGRRERARDDASARRESRLLPAEVGRRAALEEAARDDSSLDLARPLPDPVNPQLAEEAGGCVLDHVPAASHYLERRSATPPAISEA